jgi:peptidyl-tRNA hydrolase
VTAPPPPGGPATGASLDWCHARLRAGSAGAEDPEDRGTVRSMPIVLHLPKADLPARTPLLEAVAGAVAALCLDERVAPGGPWHEAYGAWLDARMRKIARRARGAQWRTALDVPGVTCEVDGCMARAFVPGPVDEVDARLGRLQIGGTELERDDPGPPPPGVPVVWVDAALEMTVGKAAAQVGHGVMLLAAVMDRPRLEGWIADGLPVAVREAGPDRWRELSAAVTAESPGLAAVVDAGYTEVAPGSLTVIAAAGE